MNQFLEDQKRKTRLKEVREETGVNFAYVSKLDHKFEYSVSFVKKMKDWSGFEKGVVELAKSINKGTARELMGENISIIFKYIRSRWCEYINYRSREFGYQPDRVTDSYWYIFGEVFPSQLAFANHGKIGSRPPRD